MSLPTGSRLGMYEVLSLLGAGGMGEVYLAHDSKLDRDVAIKVLPALFAQDPARLSRFKREAQLLAALNHSNIAAIYGQEEHNGILFLVLEMVPGETLAERLRTGPIEIEESVAICRQIAEALESAHEKGVLHRDLKPANVKITPEGKVKVLDFGLAKALDTDGSDASLMHSPTISVAATRHGVVLGTAAYMSPEQARGRTLDRRTDIWSFGCVLYEALTGKQVFGGATTSDMTAAVLRQDPDWDALPSGTPQRIRELLRRCLQKDVARRLRDIGDVRLELEESLGEPATAVVPPRAVTRRMTLSRAMPWVLSGLLAVVLVAIYTGRVSLGSNAAPPPVVRFAVTLPEKESLAPWDRPAVALSPDGRTVVYVAGPQGNTRIFRRAWDKLEATPIEGTEGGTGPFFSPDGQWLAFFATDRRGNVGGNVLKKVPVSGGASIVICNVPPVASGGIWGRDGNILFTPTQGQGLFRISAEGGKCDMREPVTKLDSKSGEQAHLWPDLLPDGRTVLVAIKTVGNEESDIVALSLQSGTRQTLVKGGGSPHYLAPGYLVYARAGSLFALPFNASSITVSGSPLLIVQGVMSDPGSGASHFAVSGTGSLVYVPGEAVAFDRELVSVDRQGKARPLLEARRSFSYPRLSPDGQMVEVSIGGYNSHVWIYSIGRGMLSRLTFDGPVEWGPIWSPDGKRVAYTSMKSGQLPALFWRAADGSGAEEELLREERSALFVAAWSPDARLLVFNEVGMNTMKTDILTLAMEGPRRPAGFLRTASKEWGADFSPDGRWLTYVSDESGRSEVYVMPFPGPGAKQQISTEGGTEPAWARKGGELFYRNGEKMMAVSVRTEPSFSASAPHLLFTGAYAEHSSEDALREYDVTPDGRSFVMIREVAPKSKATQLNVVLGWRDELRKASTAERR